VFRIEAFCEDKHLPAILHSLKGLVIGQPAIQPVANAKVEGGVVKQKVNGNLLPLFAAFLKARKLQMVRPVHIKEFAKENGYAETTYSVFLSRLVKEKVLKKKAGTKGNQTVYTVIAHG
jgi:hypothetical protein